jgi:CPW-WPC domain-containing protein
MLRYYQQIKLCELRKTSHAPNRGVVSFGCQSMLHSFLFGLLLKLFVGNVRATVPTTMKDIGELFEGFPVAVVPNLSKFEAASSVMQELSRWQWPSVSFGDDRIDPSPPSHIYSCDRNYSLPCPEGFVMVSGVANWRDAKCIAPTAYQGPCSGQATSFQGMSVAAKVRWSQMCGAVWPCVGEGGCGANDMACVHVCVKNAHVTIQVCAHEGGSNRVIL